MKIKPLKANSKRQASDIQKGFIYQTWQSVYEWIHLQEGEILYLEGAEDFDKITKENAKVVQVKFRDRNITLNSIEIAEAIINYWKVLNENQNKILYHFLTPASRGKENDSPFGNTKGLDYWDKCKSGLENISSLREHLIKVIKKQSNPPLDLLDFIKNSKDSVFIELLIKPIYWITNSPNNLDIEELAKSDLIEFGKNHHVESIISESILYKLKSHLEKVACKKNIEERHLSKVNLLEEFLGDVSRFSQFQVEKSQEAQSNLVQQIFGNSDFSGTIITENIIEEANLFKTDHILKRTSLTDQYTQILRNTNFLLINGSTGMGKSTLSKLLIEKEQKHWKYVNFRKFTKPSQIDHALKIINEALVKNGMNIIFDDFNFQGDTKIYNDSFEKVVYNILQKGGRIILTSQGTLPSKISTSLNTSKESVVQVPRFSFDEVKDLVKTFECPDKVVEAWAREIYMTSKGGHPLLAHVRAKSLKESGWPAPKFLTDTTEQAEVKKETREELLEQLSSEDSRELVSRISVFTGKFKKTNALSLSTYPTPIKIPGSIFDSLIGSYIEKLEGDYFQITPLLDDAAKETYTDTDFKKLHELAGHSFIKPVLTPSDLSNIFLHGYVSGSGYVLMRASEVFQSIKSEDKKNIYPYLEWFIYIQGENNQKLFKEDEVLSSTLRYTQFIIAAKLDPKYAVKVADSWKAEIDTFSAKTTSGKKYPKELELMPFMFYLTVFMKLNVDFPIDKYMKWVCDAIVFIKNYPEVEEVFPTKKFEGQVMDFKHIAIQTLLSKRIKYSDIDQFIKVIKEHKEGEYVLSIIDKDYELYSRFTDQIWMDESKKEKQEWDKVKISFDKLMAFAQENKVKNLIASIYRGLAVVENEYLNNMKGAENILEIAIKSIGPHSLLLNYKAKIYFIEKDYKKALMQWDKLLPSWKEADSLTFAFAYRDASVSAGYLGDWVKAEEYAKQSVDYSSKTFDRIYEEQCRADYAFTLWKQGKRKNALLVFCSVVENLQKLPPPEENLRTLGLIKMLGTTFLWILKQVNPHRKFNEDNIVPYPGIFSNLDFNEQLKKSPISSPNSLLTFLAEIEEIIGAGDIISQKLASTKEELSVLFRAEAEAFAVGKSLSNGNTESLIEEVCKFIAYTKKSFVTEERHKQTITLTPEEISSFANKNITMILDALSLSIIKAINDEKLNDLPLKKWEDDARIFRFDKTKIWQDWYDMVLKRDSLTLYELENIFKDGKQNFSLRLLASILVLSHEPSPNTNFYASAILFNVINKFYTYWRSYIEKNLESLVTKKWEDIIKKQRIHLNSPSVNIPEIELALKDKESIGLKKVSKVLLAAMNAVDVRIDQNLITEISA